jgi:hypothetical protein
MCRANCSASVHRREHAPDVATVEMQQQTRGDDDRNDDQGEDDAWRAHARQPTEVPLNVP